MRFRSKKLHYSVLPFVEQWVELDYRQQVQVEDYFCIVHREWLLSVSISSADCRAINNILLGWGFVFVSCLLALHLGFNSARKIPYLHDPSNASHLKRIQMRNSPSISPISFNNSAWKRTQWPWLIKYSSLVCILKTQPSLCLYSVLVLSTYKGAGL